MNERDLRQLRQIVQEAGSLLLGYFNRPLQVDLKAGKSPVTNADLVVNEFLQRRLQQLEPSAVFVSEESEERDLQVPRAWVVDPLDGTTNFIHGIPFFAVAVAYREYQQTVASVVYAPALNLMFWADKSGAYLGEQRLPIAQATNAPFILFVNPKLYGRFSQLNSYLPENFVCRYLGAVALEFAFAAMDQRASLITLPLESWDLLPGLCLLERSGGSRLELEGVGSLQLFGRPTF